MPKTSAGIVLYRKRGNEIEFFLVHPDGPIYGHKDDGHWDIPKGEIKDGEDLFLAAKREFQEETGFDMPLGNCEPLGSITQKSGKIVHAWACEGDADPTTLKSNHFEIEWPPRSGRIQSFPEADRAEWFTLEAARAKIIPSEFELLERTANIINI